MAIFKIEPHEQYTLKGILDYISDSTVHDNQILFTDALYAINTNPLYDMMIIKLLNCKTAGVQYKQITLSLNEEESERQTDFICLCQEAAWLLYNYTHCQIAYAVHGNTDNLHTHFILNSVSYLDGHKLHLGWQDTAYLKSKINALLRRYGFSLITCEKFIN